MSYDTLEVRIDERGVASVTLNLPERRNALSAAMIEDLTAAAHTLGGSKAVRAVVLSGAGCDRWQAKSLLSPRPPELACPPGARGDTKWFRVILGSSGAGHGTGV